MTTLLIATFFIALALTLWSIVGHKSVYLSATFVALVVVLSIATAFSYRYNQHEEYGNDAQYVGLLSPGAKYSVALPESCRFLLQTNEVATISLGKKCAIVLDKASIAGVAVGRSYLGVRRVNGRISLDGAVFDGAGNRILFINHNVFTVDSNQVVRNLVRMNAVGTQDLRIFDMSNRLIVHIDFRNATNIYFVGTLSDTRQTPLVIKDDVMLMGGTSLVGNCYKDEITHF
jgi:hypothetical protein